MVVTSKSILESKDTKKFRVHMVEHLVEHETPRQRSHTGHQENHSLRSHMALLKGHQKHLVSSVRPF